MEQVPAFWPSLVKLSYAMNTQMYNLKKMARMIVYLQYFGSFRVILYSYHIYHEMKKNLFLKNYINL